MKLTIKFFLSSQMGLYKNKFKIESSRLKDWDYSTPSWYYITICTKNMISWFGDIKNSIMVLNESGEVVDSEWKKTPVIRKMVELDYYVIMPNHFHGIIIINGEENRNVVEMHRDASLRMVKNNLSNIIRGFKGSVTKQLHSNGFQSFQWQPRFYDHIIRNENDLHRVRTYIRNNPLKWELDEYYLKT